eukprot:TRINITY_DN22827_c0_g1_i1.p1 TRINITY_DN22827_c0_g1~~TRINITY_DN22827_c0_g1_i1.p1  ORF type:complete len:579 (-),score=78.25 TRINITY_DN22827_c0_g1_i1:308-2044(-)
MNKSPSGTEHFPPPNGELTPKQMMLTKSSSLSQLTLSHGFGSTGGLSGLIKSPSALSLPRSPAATASFFSKQVPEHIRKEFHRYSTPIHGAMGRNNVKKVLQYFKFQKYIEGAENRSVNLPQLLEVQNFAFANTQSWGVDRPTLDLHSINKWIIQPVTKDSFAAMSEHLVCKRYLPPAWFVSHFWGDVMANFLRCIRQHIAVRGLTSTTTYWVCAYVLRQQEFIDDMCGDPRQGNFFRAIQMTHYKVLLVMNEDDHPEGIAVPFRRTWCAFECAMLLERAAPCLDVAVPCGSQVELVTAGLTGGEANANKYAPGRGMTVKIQRERGFPESILRAGLLFKITHTQTSDEKDKHYLMNAVAGNDFHGAAPEEHDNYDDFGRRLRSLFALVFWHRALSSEQPTAKVAKTRHIEFLLTLAKAIKGDYWRTNLNLGLAGCPLNSTEMVQIVLNSIPENLVNLKIDFRYSGIPNSCMGIIANTMPKKLQNLTLDFSACSEIDNSGMLEFIQQLPAAVSKLEICLDGTNVSNACKILFLFPVADVRHWGEAGPTEQVEILKKCEKFRGSHKNGLFNEEDSASRNR